MVDHRGRERKIVANTNLFKWNGELEDLELNADEVHAVFWIEIDDILRIEQGDSATIHGINPAGEILEKTVAISDFVFNLDSYHFRIAERIERYEAAR